LAHIWGKDLRNEWKCGGTLKIAVITLLLKRNGDEKDILDAAREKK
jgi:hypothetical protein